MKTIKDVTVYKCDHCNKKYFREKACVNHEKMCYQNPANFRPCFICPNLEKKEVVIYFDTYNGQMEETRQVFHCNHFGTFLHTPQNAIKGNAFELDEGNEEMPSECAVFKNARFDSRF